MGTLSAQRLAQQSHEIRGLYITCTATFRTGIVKIFLIYSASHQFLSASHPTLSRLAK